MIRAALKDAFKGTKFSVRCSRGSAIDIRWIDGPTTHDVEAVANLYRGGGFDGMQDLRYSIQTFLTTESGAEKVQFGADFVFCHREYSQQALDIARAGITRITGKPCKLTAWPGDQSQDDWRTQYHVVVWGEDRQMAAYDGTEDAGRIVHQWLGARTLTGITD